MARTMITLGGDLRVGRIGNGAMRLTGFHCGCVYGNHHVVRPTREPVAHAGRWSLSIQRSEGIS
jgi:hypothetical protein